MQPASAPPLYSPKVQLAHAVAPACALVPRGHGAYCIAAPSTAGITVELKVLAPHGTQPDPPSALPGQHRHKGMAAVTATS